ncbi:hypothetical protein pEaSNUABM56_00003 [Erwinia phage pEa_SNUABM_56]|uniref:Uncharacterized protein n=1 Tax=Erwinia phage pEp_SNUABM_01 TaxID=2601643 RepID=A0A5J6DBJ9_9CAUD|nr:hypothetical protein HWC63_gp125 [Erwinia phage pEp_SNUABM_01]QEQ95053.1 hypothetical protein pEpSNUABM01_227 [Erwinia phage pEp_SNUABM_01]UYL85048.1 hypothetical protein pEaSNUABM56_00003 [Erwinia phage pEa_SNUABM_56]
MIASIVLASFLCTVQPNNADDCKSSYEQYWTSTSASYAKDQADCVAMLDRLYPDDVTNDPKDPNKFTFAGCYRVLPGSDVGAPDNAGAVYLQNVQDADDNFFESIDKIPQTND